jgi:hypothetical protein
MPSATAPAVISPMAIVVAGIASDEPVRARPVADVLATVSVSAATREGSPQATDTETAPETPVGTVALKLKLPVALAVPEPIFVPLTDADTAALGVAPVPLIVTVSPGDTFVVDAVAAHPP